MATVAVADPQQNADAAFTFVDHQPLVAPNSLMLQQQQAQQEVVDSIVTDASFRCIQTLSFSVSPPPPPQEYSHDQDGAVVVDALASSSVDIAEPFVGDSVNSSSPLRAKTDRTRTFASSESNSDPATDRKPGFEHPSPTTVATTIIAPTSTSPFQTCTKKKSLRQILELDCCSTNINGDHDKRDCRPQPWVVGHRGALYEELENTREGFVKCAQWGCDAVELDVLFLEQDQTLIVFHGGGTDDEPGDLTDYCLDQEGVDIRNLSFAETQTLKFNHNFKEFPCPLESIQKARIPTLEEVLLDLKQTSTNIKIELKGPGTVEPTLEVVERLNMVHQCQFSSFDFDRLRLLRQLRPEKDTKTQQYIYKTGALFDYGVPNNYLQLALDVGASEVHIAYDELTVQRVHDIRNAGLQSMAFLKSPQEMERDAKEIYCDIGNEDESCYQAIIDTGVDQICCNRPDLLVAILLNQQQQPQRNQ